MHPEAWGASPTGTGGGADNFRSPEALNANPSAFAMLPHASSILLRGAESEAEAGPDAALKKRPIAAWDRASGRLSIETTHTMAVAGPTRGRSARFGSATIAIEGPTATVAVSSPDDGPIAEARRLLISAVARAEPTGLLYADPLRREVADPGHGPILLEPVRARMTWDHEGPIAAYTLGPDGRRISPATLEAGEDGGPPTLLIEGRDGAIYWELSVADKPSTDIESP